MNFCGYEFEVFQNTSSLKDISGVYVILGQNNELIYVGESGEVKNRIEVNHKKKTCWISHRFKMLGVHYTNEYSRKKIEKEIIQKHRPPCNKK